MNKSSFKALIPVRFYFQVQLRKVELVKKSRKAKTQHMVYRMDIILTIIFELLKYSKLCKVCSPQIEVVSTFNDWLQNKLSHLFSYGYAKRISIQSSKKSNFFASNKKVGILHSQFDNSP